MRAGAVDGLSIGFRTVRGRSDAKTGVRRLYEVDLWEISVVTFPMLPAARVTRVKGLAGTAELAVAMRKAARAIGAFPPPLRGRAGVGERRRAAV
jgi:phage head maturation protease